MSSSTVGLGDVRNHAGPRSMPNRSSAAEGEDKGGEGQLGVGVGRGCTNAMALA